MIIYLFFVFVDMLEDNNKYKNKKVYGEFYLLWM